MHYYVSLLDPVTFEWLEDITFKDINGKKSQGSISVPINLIFIYLKHNITQRVYILARGKT